MASFKREATAIFGILIISIFLFFLPPIYFQILTLLFIFLTSFEICLFLCNDFLLLKIFIPLFSISWAFYYFFQEFFLKFLLPLNLILPLFLILFKKPKSKERTLQLFSSISIPILTGLFGGSLAYLRTVKNEETGLKTVVYILIVVWVSDSLAYYIGKKFGRKKISPDISPNKTVEGTMALLLGSIIVTIIYFGFSFLNLIIGISIGFSNFFGDLFQSYCKRTLNIKDSGKIFPGHGGFWDRTDSLFFSSYVFYLIKSL